VRHLRYSSVTRHPFTQLGDVLGWRTPKKRPYSQLNCEALTYPTCRLAVPASIIADSIRYLASWRRSTFWYCRGSSRCRLEVLVERRGTHVRSSARSSTFIGCEKLARNQTRLSRSCTLTRDADLGHPGADRAEEQRIRISSTMSAAHKYRLPRPIAETSGFLLPKLRFSNVSPVAIQDRNIVSAPDHLVANPQSVVRPPFNRLSLREQPRSSSVQRHRMQLNIVTPVDPRDDQEAHLIDETGIEERTIDVAASFEEQRSNPEVLAQQAHGSSRGRPRAVLKRRRRCPCRRALRDSLQAPVRSQRK